MTYIDLNLEKTFKYAIHIADIHIYNDDTSLDSRIDEYKLVFHNLILDIKNRKLKKKHTLIVIAGDIFNDARKDKGKTSANAVILFKNLISKLCKLGIVVIIPGNHDNNITYQDKHDHSIIDTLSSLLNSIVGLDKTIYYLKNTGIYKLGNCIFYTVSVFDLDCINRKEDYPARKALLPKRLNGLSDDNIHIGLFHCGIQGQVTQNGFIMKDSTYTLNDIKEYDLTMLGDTHSHQFFTERIAYPSSLIQQNYGESIDKHGYIQWDLIEKKGKFIKIMNDYGYISLFSPKTYMYKNEDNINKKISTKLYSIDDIDTMFFPLNSRIKFIYSLDEHLNIETIQEQIGYKTKIIKWEENRLLLSRDNDSNNDITEPTLNHLYNFTLYLNNLYNEDSDEYTYILNNIKKLFQDSESLYSNQSWFFLRLKVENFQKYKGKHILLDFENVTKHSIISILGKNTSGKSTIIRALGYSIWGKDIVSLESYINNESIYTCCELEFRYNNKDYKIVRKLNKNKAGQQPLEKVLLLVYENNIWIDKSESFKKHTETKIKSIFGERDDAKTTWLSTQNASTHFLNDNNNVAILTRLIGVDLFDIEYKKQLKCKKLLENKLTKLDMEIDIYKVEEIGVCEIDTLKSKISKIESDKIDLTEKIETEKNKRQFGTLKDYNNWLFKKQDIDLELEDLKIEVPNQEFHLNKLEELNEKLTNLENQKNKHLLDIEAIPYDSIDLEKMKVRKISILELLNDEKNGLEKKLSRIENISKIDYEYSISEQGILKSKLERENKLSLDKENLEKEYNKKKEYLEKHDTKDKLESKKIKLELEKNKLEEKINQNIGILQSFDIKYLHKIEEKHNKLIKKISILKNTIEKYNLTIDNLQKLILPIDYKYVTIIEKLNILNDKKKDLHIKLEKIQKYESLLNETKRNLRKTNKLVFEDECLCCKKNKRHFKIDVYESKIERYNIKMNMIQMELEDLYSTIWELEFFVDLKEQYESNILIEEKIKTTEIVLDTTKNNLSDNMQLLENLEKELEDYNNFERLHNENQENTNISMKLEKEILSIKKKMNKYIENESEMKNVNMKLNNIVLLTDRENISLLENIEKHKLIIERYNCLLDIKSNLDIKIEKYEKLKEDLENINNQLNKLEKNKILNNKILNLEKENKILKTEREKQIETYLKIKDLEEKYNDLLESVEKFQNFSLELLNDYMEIYKKIDIDLIECKTNLGMKLERKKQIDQHFIKYNKLLENNKLLLKNLDKLIAYINVLDPQRGYPRELIDKTLVRLSYMVDEFVAFAGFDYKTIFKQPEKKKGMKNNKNKLVISHNKKGTSFSTLSGAEEFTFHLGTLTALSQLSNMSKSPILVIDEGFSCLDMEHINEVGPILEHLKEYYHYILNISHIEKIHEYSDIIKKCINGSVTNF